MEEEIGPFEENAEVLGVTSISDDSGASETGDAKVKTVNGQSILGAGNIKIRGGGVGAHVDGTTVSFDEDAVYVSGTTIIFDEEEEG